ncbi:YcxB family protein [Sphingomonas sp. OK281]|uniref:YcxB family protein n=1 Tax=Sphingomonas sp. OK281 TaxID=1881067 RepID=UPI0008EF0A3C|nr:YcxB family protein [Sphingomonas sp. OK281]SFN97507.1 YcxB-like protein [Sphingomonas sp. OK281]
MADRFAFTPIADDYIAVARGSFLRSLKRRRFIVRMVIILLIGAAAGAAIGLLDTGSVRTGDVLFGVCIALIWLAVILAIAFVFIPRRARRLFRQQRALDREFSFAWTDERVVFRSDTSMSDMPWSDYHDWFETKAIFAFGLNEQLFHFAPKRAMSAAAIDDLRRTAQVVRPT